MKDYQERTKSIKAKTSALKRRRIALCSAAALCVVVLVCGIMAIPMFGPDAPDLDEYKSSSYYPLLSVLHTQYASQVPDKQSAWQKIEDSIWGDQVADDQFINMGLDQSMTPPTTSAPSEGTPDISPEYQETTLNQVDGVVEGDLLKRSDTHAFYLTHRTDESGKREYVLQVYSLDRQGWTVQPTTPIATCVIQAQDDMLFGAYYNGWWNCCEPEMFLSQDATRVTLLLPCVNQQKRDGQITAPVVYLHNNWYTCLVSLDVSNPTAVRECNRVYVSGKYETSRKVDDKLLMVTNYRLNNVIDYDDALTYVPHWGVGGDMQVFPMEDVYLPDELDTCAYTVIMELDERDLTVVDKQALLSYTTEVAVSSEHLFVTRQRRQLTDPNGQVLEKLPDNIPAGSRRATVTDIVYVRYGDKLAVEGCVTIEGEIKDRYSMDEYNGMLRVAVTDTEGAYREVHYTNREGQLTTYTVAEETTTNASLYCIDLQDGSIAGAVRRFAKGERVQSARFVENTAYVCTAVQNTDPVFAFDLSNPDHITYKDTGTIPGYSISLLPFGDCLLGIGYGDTSRNLKIELYKQTDSAVVSVACFELADCYFSTEYKAHYVDAGRGLVGLEVRVANSVGPRYLLLKFDGQELSPLYYGVYGDNVDTVRAFYADDGVYVVSAVGMIFIDPTYKYQLYR